MLALQHDSNGNFSHLHDHALEMHIEATLKNRKEINSLLEKLNSVDLTEKQRALLTKFGETRERFSKEGINLAREQLGQGKYIV